LNENSFMSLNGREWVKINLKGIYNIPDLRQYINGFLENYNYFDSLLGYLDNLITEIEIDKQTEKIITLEKLVWPLKINTPYISNFLVPIHANGAMDLFDHQLGSQLLFGSNPDLVFKMENVYYRSSKTKVPTARTRILWYVSQGTTKNFQGTMAIRACSYVDEVEVDTPKRIFSRNKKLGVYNWQNLLKTTSGDLKKELLCFRFSRTELFDYPIPLKIYKQISGKKSAPQSTQFIDEELFFTLYKDGFRCRG